MEAFVFAQWRIARGLIMLGRCVLCPLLRREALTFKSGIEVSFIFWCELVFLRSLDITIILTHYSKKRIVTISCSHLPILVSEVVDNLDDWLVDLFAIGAEGASDRGWADIVADRVIERMRRQLQHIILLLFPTIVVPQRVPLMGEEIWYFVRALVLISRFYVERGAVGQGLAHWRRRLIISCCRVFAPWAGIIQLVVSGRVAGVAAHRSCRKARCVLHSGLHASQLSHSNTPIIWLTHTIDDGTAS